MFINVKKTYMPKKTVRLMPRSLEILETMGNQIRLARLRRDYSVELIAERARVSRTTVWAIEKGSPSVSMGAYAAVLHAINGLDTELLNVAKEDRLGRLLQDSGFKTRKRASK